MFEYLQQIDIRIYDRYLTLEKNIKSASNSFYDSYLDLQEQFLKTIIEKNSVFVASHESCGALLKRSDVKELFLSKYGLDFNTYDKMGDYAKKTNEHKHRKEKTIEADTIVSYMHVFYDVSSRCAIAQGLNVPQFNGKYFKDIYGSMENLYSSIAEISERLGRLEEGQQKHIDDSKRDSERQSVQPEKNTQNDRMVLKNFIAKSEKKYNWFGTKEQFRKHKRILICIQVALIVIGLLSTIISSICLKLYSTFTLFENIVLIQMIILLSYTIKAKKLYCDYDLAKHTPDIFIQDEDGIWCNTNREKKRYKWLRRISYVSVVANIISIWAMGSCTGLQVVATVVELAFLVFAVASVFVRINLYCMYGALFISALNFSGTEMVTIVHDDIQKKLCTLEEYQKCYPDFV